MHIQSRGTRTIACCCEKVLSTVLVADFPQKRLKLNQRFDEKDVCLWIFFVQFRCLRCRANVNNCARMESQGGQLPQCSGHTRSGFTCLSPLADLQPKGVEESPNHAFQCHYLLRINPHSVKSSVAGTRWLQCFRQQSRQCSLNDPRPSRLHRSTCVFAIADREGFRNPQM